MANQRLIVPEPAPERRVFANRTLKMSSIKAIGYDMDYTLTHYRAEAFEEFAFSHAREYLAHLGWPVEAISFDPAFTARGLVIDRQLGNIVKATRFGWVVRAMHGSRFLDHDEFRSTYHGAPVDLSDDRYVFLNTLFSLSEASLFSHGVDLLDAGRLPGGIGYSDVFSAVEAAVNEVHRGGALKRGVLADPERFIALDGDIVASLRDQKNADKRLMLITNSEWNFTSGIMAYTFDPFLPAGHTWRDLFDIVIVSAAKPGFFTWSNPLFKVVDEGRGLLEPYFGSLDSGGVFYGGNARLVEESLGLTGDEILYVGDHLYGDVHYSKALLRWRTALILQELESEVLAMSRFLPTQERLTALMEDKERLEAELSALRLAEQRVRKGYAKAMIDVEDPADAIVRTSDELTALNDLIAPLAVEAGQLQSRAWGPMMRADADKSLFARQIERYADVYTSRVSNLLFPGPYATFRMEHLNLPHDPHR